MKKRKIIAASAAMLVMTSCTKYDPSANISEDVYGPPSEMGYEEEEQEYGEEIPEGEAVNEEADQEESH